VRQSCQTHSFCCLLQNIYIYILNFLLGHFVYVRFTFLPKKGINLTIFPESYNFKLNLRPTYIAISGKRALRQSYTQNFNRDLSSKKVYKVEVCRCSRTSRIRRQNDRPDRPLIDTWLGSRVPVRRQCYHDRSYCRTTYKQSTRFR
jgi:hypothetical protein